MESDQSLGADDANVLRGADNLLKTCIGVKPGQTVLLVVEPSHEKFYDESLTHVLQNRIVESGASVTTIAADIISDPSDFPVSVSRLMEQVDHTLFVSRIGDYVRFVPLSGSSSKTVCYAQNVDMLASAYAGTSHDLMTQLLRKLETELQHAKNWRVTCSLGTDIAGTFCWPGLKGEEDDDFSIELFPVATFKPVPCDTATGKVALSRWVTPGGATKLEPATVLFDDVVTINVVNGMLTGISGAEASAQKLSSHYDFVSSELNINRNKIHSWHTGMNPHTTFIGDAKRELKRWTAMSFASPRYLHFHTCGDHPPGEITWPVFNATVYIDEKPYWENGKFVWLQRHDNLELLKQFEGGERLLEESGDIGV